MPTLWINNECLSEGITVDIRSVVASLKGSGEYYILTCSFGEPGCAGIWEGIIVIHEADSTRWLIPYNNQNSMESNDKGNESILTFKEKLFRRADYWQAISSAIETAKSMIMEDIEGYETGPHGFIIRELMQIHVAWEEER